MNVTGPGDVSLESRAGLPTTATKTEQVALHGVYQKQSLLSMFSAWNSRRDSHCDICSSCGIGEKATSGAENKAKRVSAFTSWGL